MQEKKNPIPSKSEISRIASILGTLGGSSKSEAKTKAVRENGKLGGRPAGKKNKNNLK